MTNQKDKIQTNNKKKLLVLASTFPRWNNDTIPAFVYELSKRLTQDFEVHVLAPSFPGAKDFEIMDDMKVYRFHYFFKKYEKLAGSGGILPVMKKNKLYLAQVPFFVAAEFFALRKLAKKINPDVIHAHWIIPQGFVAALNKKFEGTDYVVTSHGSDIMGLKGLTGIKKFILRNAKAITVVSNALREKIHEEIDSSLRIDIIPMGIDTELFNPNKKDTTIREKFNIRGPFLLFVGRLAPEKGIDLLIEAMPNVIKKYPNAKLMIIGKGTLENEIKKRVKQLNIQDNILFMGWIDNKDLPKYYATAEIFVCPSRREGSPVSYIEALSCGTQILVGDIPISREIIKNGGGVTVDYNAKDIAEKIIIHFEKNAKKNIVAQSIRVNYDHVQINRKFLEVLI